MLDYFARILPLLGACAEMNPWPILTIRAIMSLWLGARAGLWSHRARPGSTSSSISSSFPSPSLVIPSQLLLWQRPSLQTSHYSHSFANHLSANDRIRYIHLRHRSNSIYCASKEGSDNPAYTNYVAFECATSTSTYTNHLTTG